MALAALAACSPADHGPAADTGNPVLAEENEPPAQTSAQPSDQPGKQPQDLPEGEYRVAGTNGADINLAHGISVTADTIEVVSECVTLRWTYRREDGRMLTEALDEPICERELYPAEEALLAVFDDPQQVTHTPANGLLVTGNGQSVTLFSQ